MKLEPANIVCPKCGSGNYMYHLIGKNVGRLDMKCINCNSYFNFDELYKQKITEVVKQQTNADRIRGMSDEELAEWIVHKTEGNGFDGYEQSVLAWLRWLKSPAESSVFESIRRGLEQAINGETRSETLTLTKDGET